MDKRGIPKEIIKELDIKSKKPKEVYEVGVVVEMHQVKIPLPKKIRLALKLNKGARCRIIYDQIKKEVICKF
ncbi:MAG: hypothetical protein AABX35_02400 [Nanoarchaeota archaeon]